MDNKERTARRADLLPPIVDGAIKNIDRVKADLTSILAILGATSPDTEAFLLGIREAVNRHRFIVEGIWPCPSSLTKKCWYNSELDPSHDGCLFCGEPEERK